MYYTYVLKNKKSGRLYTGYTNDLRKRFKEHNDRKSTYTKYRGPYELVYYEACVDENDAKARELYLKTGKGKRYLKSRLKRFLFRYRMRAKKSLGQHFLRSEKALASIVRAGELTPEDVVLEIGPGEGVLTQKLLACSLQLIAVEKDDGLYESLKAKFQKEITSGQLTLVHGDILDFKPQNYKLQATSYKLIANIPYNITGQILRKFLSLEAYPDKIVLLVQKEVALRIIARDGKESILSISIKAYGKPKYIETVKAGSFAPAPNVDSAIIAIEGISKEFFLPAGRHGKDLSERAFFEALRAGFSSKRKKLSSNLSAVLPKDRIKEIFNELEWNENVRAEDISIEDWRKIAVYFNV